MHTKWSLRCETEQKTKVWKLDREKMWTKIMRSGQGKKRKMQSKSKYVQNGGAVSTKRKNITNKKEKKNKEKSKRSGVGRRTIFRKRPE